MLIGSLILVGVTSAGIYSTSAYQAEVRRMSAVGDTVGAEIGLQINDDKRVGHGFCDKQGRGNGKGCGHCKHHAQNQ